MSRSAPPPLLYEPDGAICRITLNRPEVLNALNTELLKESKTGQVYAQPEPHSVSRGPVYDKDILIRKRPPSEYTRAKPGG